MTHPTALPLAAASFAPSPLLAVVATLTAVALLLAGWLIRRRRSRTGSERSGNPAVWVAALAAVGCTAYSADTSWRFAADYLDMGSTLERAAMFSAAELALFATALMARQNLRSQGAPGVPGVLTWVITGVQIIPAYAESGPVGGTVRAFVGPTMAALLWHQAMGIELRLHKPEAASNGVLAVLGREIRERLLSRLGVAERDRDAAQITRDRATAQAVSLAARLAERSPKRRETWRGRRIARRLSKALARAGVGTDLQQRRDLLDQLAARRHATSLATVDLPSPWTQPTQDQEEDYGARHLIRLSPVGNQPSHWLRPVPDAGPEGGTPPTGDRPEGDHTGSSAGTEPADNGDRPHSVPDNGDSASAGDQANEEDSHLATRDGAANGDRDATVPGTDEPGDKAGGSAGHAHKSAAQRSISPSPTLVPNDGDQDRHGTGTGTARNGDRPHTVPSRRKSKASRTRSRGQVARSRKQPQLTVDQMVERVRPHVPALLERDGNEAVTRVQLREILRAEGLQGGRNERLTPVLERLRSQTSTPMTRSNTR